MKTDSAAKVKTKDATQIVSHAVLGRTICPGCGEENPKSDSLSYFCCAQCQWEADDGLPNIAGIIRGKFTNCDNVNLTNFLRTLLRRQKVFILSKTNIEPDTYTGM
jgi:hypothetical protein